MLCVVGVAVFWCIVLYSVSVVLIVRLSKYSVFMS